MWESVCVVCVRSKLYLFIYLLLVIRYSETSQASLVAELDPRLFTCRYVHKSKKPYLSIRLKFACSINLLSAFTQNIKNDPCGGTENCSNGGG